MLERLVIEASKVNLKLNVGPTKTAWLALGRLPEAPDELHVPGLQQPVPRVGDYRYLGVPVVSQHVHGPLADRVRLAWAATHRLTSLWQLPLSRDIKRRLFDCLVRPVLTYGLGTYQIHTKALQWVDQQELHMRRVALQVGRLDEFGFPRHSQELRGSTPSISEHCHTAAAQLFGHVLRHGTLLEAAILWQSTTPRGRRQWPRAPSSSLARALGFDSGLDLIDVARDRSAWHHLVTRQQASYASAVRTFTPVTALRAWNRVLKHAHTYEELQFVEEGSQSFILPGHELHVYTDGSRVSRSVPNGSVVQAAGVGLLLCGHDRQHLARSWSLLSEVDTCSDRAELYAAIGALKAALALDQPLVLHTDSAYVWQFLINQRRQHRINGFSALRNSDLLRTLDGLVRTLVHVNHRDFYVIKVRSHNGNPHNEHADFLAQQGAAYAAWARSDAILPPSVTSSPAPPGAAVRRAHKFYCPLCPERRYKRAQDLKRHFTVSHPARRFELLRRARLAAPRAWSACTEEEVDL